MQRKIVLTRDDAYNLLQEFNAPEHLKTHVKLVGEAADILIEKLKEMNVEIDTNFIQVGVAIHDVGKIIHTNEMTGPGSEHEPDGERILLEHGINKKIARCCLSHARWSQMECSVEELIIALSDKLWKGKRIEELELKVIDEIALLLGKERWDIFSELDYQFELIAFGGHERLQRSVIS